MSYNFKSISFAALFLMSCGSIDKPSEITEEIEGKYMFKYPTGQVETISINLDSTYDQRIYSNEDDYLKLGEPLYSNDGNWSISGKELEFKHWLEYCYLRNPDSILAEPRYVDMGDVVWRKRMDQDNAIISIYPENNYVFRKVGEN